MTHKKDNSRPFTALLILGIALNVVVLILSILTILPIVSAEAANKTLLCAMIIIVQICSLVVGNLYQNKIEKKYFSSFLPDKKDVSKKDLVRMLAPYKEGSDLYNREKIRKVLTVATTVILICALIWSILTKDHFKFMIVTCITAIAFIYIDYITYNSQYTKRYDLKFCRKEKPNSIRGLARIYRYEYAELGFKRIKNRKRYKDLAQYNEDGGRLQDECIKCILFSKIDAIKNPEIYYGAVVTFFNIFLIIPNIPDIVAKDILRFDDDIADILLPLVLILVNVVFAVWNIVSMCRFNKQCAYIADIAAAMPKKEKTKDKMTKIESMRNRYELYQCLQKTFDFKLIVARGIHMFNAQAIDAGKNLDDFLNKKADGKERQDECSRSEDGKNHKAYLKYRMLYIHKFYTNFQRFFHTVILSCVALLCLLLELNIKWEIIGTVFICAAVFVALFAVFVLPNIGRYRIAKQCKLLNENDKQGEYQMKFKRWIRELLFGSLFAIAWGIVVLLCRRSFFISVISFLALDCIVGYVYKNKIITDKQYCLALSRSENDNKKKFNPEYYDLYHEFNYNRIIVILRSIAVALTLAPVIFAGITDPLKYITYEFFLILAVFLLVSILLFSRRRDVLIMELINKRKTDWFNDYTAEDIEILNKLGNLGRNIGRHG